MTIYEKLGNVQVSLKVPKTEFNAFGKYKYRTAENILEEVKPLLRQQKAVIVINDSLEQLGERYYIKATIDFIDTETSEKITVSAFAREEESKRGMDGSQVTGASSSYARKYALNGLFSIDDTKDSDTTNKHDKEPPKPKGPPTITKEQAKEMAAVADGDIELIKKIMGKYNYTQSKDVLVSDFNKILVEIAGNKEKKEAVNE